jgi:hypothetical protein
MAVVLNLSSYSAPLLALDSEEWEASIPDIIHNLKIYADDCQLLHKMCQDFLIQQKRGAPLENITHRLRESNNQRRREAERKDELAKKWGFWGLVLAPVTLGASAVVAVGPAAALSLSAGHMMGNDENAELDSITWQMTQVVDKFLEVLWASADFFYETRDLLEDMLAKAVRAQHEMENRGLIKVYFKIMRSYAERINASCNVFVKSTAEVGEKEYYLILICLDAIEKKTLLSLHRWPSLIHHTAIIPFQAYLKPQ